MHLKLLAETSW